MSNGNNREYLEAEELFEDAEEALASGDRKAAETLLREVIEKNPYFSYAYRSLSDIVAFNGRLSDAVRILDQCLKTDPGFADAHYLSAKYRFRSGDKAGAMKSLSAAVKLSPENRLYSLAQKNLSLLIRER